MLHGRWVPVVQVCSGVISQETGYRRAEQQRADMDVTSESQGPWVRARRAMIAVL